MTSKPSLTVHPSNRDRTVAELQQALYDGIMRNDPNRLTEACTLDRRLGARADLREVPRPTTTFIDE